MAWLAGAGGTVHHAPRLGSSKSQLRDAVMCIAPRQCRSTNNVLLAPDARDPRGFSVRLSDFGLSLAQHQWRTATTMEGKGTVRGGRGWPGNCRCRTCALACRASQHGCMPEPAAPCRQDPSLWTAPSTSNHWAPSSAWLLLCKVTADPLSTAPHTQPRCSCNLQLAFMPPEAFDDDAEKLNEKLDVYSMGVCGERADSGWVSVLGAEEFVRGCPPFPRKCSCCGGGSPFGSVPTTAALHTGNAT